MMVDETRKDQASPFDEDVQPTPGGQAADQVPGAPEGEAPEAADVASELAETKDRLLRALAEMENLRRRTQRDLDEARKYAVTGFARGLLEVADNLSRALAAVPPDRRAEDEFMTSLVAGVEMTERMLHDLFEKNEIRKVAPRRGDRFDHNLHQAMFEQPSTDLPTGAIAEVLQPGYVIADRLLRPAMVGVAKATPATAPGNGGGTTQAPGSTVDTVA